MSYQIKIPSCIFGGAGSIENVKAVIEKENAKKVIIFTDKGIRSTGLLDLLTDILEENKTEYQVFDETLDEINYQIILQVLHEEHDNKEKTARRLGISRSTLWRILKNNN